MNYRIGSSLLIFICAFFLGAASLAGDLKITGHDALQQAWSGSSHPVLFVDELYLSEDLNKQVFVKFDVPVNKKRKQGRWFPAAGGMALEISRGKTVTAIFVTGLSKTKDLKNIEKHFRKQSWSRKSASLSNLFISPACAEELTTTQPSGNRTSYAATPKTDNGSIMDGALGPIISCLLSRAQKTGEGAIEGLKIVAEKVVDAKAGSPSFWEKLRNPKAVLANAKDSISKKYDSAKAFTSEKYDSAKAFTSESIDSALSFAQAASDHPDGAWSFVKEKANNLKIFAQNLVIQVGKIAAASAQDFKNLSPEEQREIICTFGVKLIATVGAVVLTGGLAVLAAARLAKIFAGVYKKFKQAKESADKVAAQAEKVQPKEPKSKKEKEKEEEEKEDEQTPAQAKEAKQAERARLNAAIDSGDFRGDKQYVVSQTSNGLRQGRILGRDARGNITVEFKRSNGEFATDTISPGQAKALFRPDPTAKNLDFPTPVFRLGETIEIPRTGAPPSKARIIFEDRDTVQVYWKENGKEITKNVTKKEVVELSELKKLALKKQADAIAKEKNAAKVQAERKKEDQSREKAAEYRRLREENDRQSGINEREGARRPGRQDSGSQSTSGGANPSASASTNGGGAAGGASRAVNAAGRAAGRAADGVRRGARATAEAARRGANAVGNAARRGAGTVGQGGRRAQREAQKAATAAAQTAKKAAASAKAAAESAKRGAAQAKDLPRNSVRALRLKILRAKRKKVQEARAARKIFERKQEAQKAKESPLPPATTKRGIDVTRDAYAQEVRKIDLISGNRRLKIVNARRILNITEDEFTEKDIKLAQRRLSNKYHGDKVSKDNPESLLHSDEVQTRINLAVDILKATKPKKK